MEPDEIHKSVLLGEVVQMLEPERGGLFVDATVGMGGHAEALLSASPHVRLVGLDQDAEALAVANHRLRRFGERVELLHANFSNIGHLDIGPASGILADLGVSSLQLDSETRGFSLRFDSPLDMRMDPGAGGETAADLLLRVNERELADIIYRYGEERASRKIARWIVEKRESGIPITTTRELAELVKRAVRPGAKDRTHPATRTFQALRIAVNGELEILSKFVADAVALLKTGGVLTIITFHSLEDRLVKNAFRYHAGRCQCPPRIPRCVCGAERTIEILTRKPVVPGLKEQEANPRAKSAKLRAGRKLQNPSP